MEGFIGGSKYAVRRDKGREASQFARIWWVIFMQKFYRLTKHVPKLGNKIKHFKSL